MKILYEIVHKNTGKHYNWTPLNGLLYYEKRADAKIYLQPHLKVKKVVISEDKELAKKEQ